MSEMAETTGEMAVEEENGEKHLIFSILDKFYSLPSQLIGEIALFDTVYPLPLMPDYVPGVINRYSVPYALFDIALLLFKTPGKRNKVLVLKDDIDRIALFDTVYPLPLMPSCVPGVVNRYSVPYALFDTGLLLFKTPGLRNKVLVLKDTIDRIAFLIDDVTGIADVPQKDLLSVERSAETDEAAETVSASFDWNGRTVFVLDIQRILAHVSGEVV